MYSEDDLLPISALQHLAFCERQCALIHLEDAWAENRQTAEGRLLHERAHSEKRTETRGDLRTTRSLRLRSLRHGLSGIADIVEFHRVAPPDAPATVISFPRTRGLWRPFPVEYKRGRPKKDDCDRVQLCAQALCLEEMLDVTIDAGALFYGGARRRFDITFDAPLRQSVEALALRLHELTRARRTPPPPSRLDKKCKNCSLEPLCMPRLATRPSVHRYLARVFDECREEEKT